MGHVSSRVPARSRPTGLCLGAGLWAISLATECGARTAIAAEERPRVLHARLEFPLIGQGKPTGLLAADLDGDAKSELIVITSSPATLQVWSGLSRTLLGWPDPLALPIDDFALGPVWFGGRAPDAKNPAAEFVFASRTTSKVVVVDARAALATKPDEPLQKKFEFTLAKRPRVLASGDLGLDHRFEIAAITIDDELVLARGPDDVVTTKLEDQQATCAAFGADGKSLFVGFQGSRRLVRYEFDAAWKARAVCAVDLDGLPRSVLEVGTATTGSILAVAGGDDALWSFLCDGKSFQKGAQPLSGGTVPYALLQGSILGSDSALVSIAIQGQEAVVHSLAQGSSGEIARAYAGQHPRAAAIGDFDGDGRNDLAIANGDAQRVGILFATKDGAFDLAASSRSGRSAHALACGDLDGDKLPEVVSIGALEGTLSVSKNVGGVLQDHRVQGRADGADAVRIADLDGDGANDAVFLEKRGESSTSIDAYFGDGKGSLFQRAEVKPVQVGVSVGDLLVTDLDGDGVLEALVADPEGGRVSIVDIVRVKDIGTKFGEPRGITVESGPKRLALIDVEGDAKPEIAVALAGPGPKLGVAFLRVKKDAGGALVLEWIRTLPMSTPVTGLAVADCDQKGLDDLVVLASKSDSDNHLEVHFQERDHSFTKSAEDLPTGLRPYALRMADLDGDSIADIVCTAQNSHHVNVWLNGGGTPLHFARLADVGVGTGPLDIQLADLDGDGQVELVVANAFSNDISVVRVR